MVTVQGITLQDLLNVAKSQGVDFRPGDILLIRTSFTRWYEELSTEEKQDCSRKLLFTGVEQGEHMERWLWNQAFSAVAGDSVAWERERNISDRSIGFNLTRNRTSGP